MNNYIKIILIVMVLDISPTIAIAENIKIKVGVSTALSGDSAPSGEDIKNIVLFANSKLGDGNFDIVFEDDKCSPKEAVSVAHKFVDIEKVDVVIGFACSGAALAAAPIYEKAKIPVIVTVGSSPKISEAGIYIFRTSPNDNLAANLLKKHILKAHSSIAIISEETNYCQDFENAFVSAKVDKPLRIINEDFPSATSDFRAILFKIKGLNPEGLFLNTQTEAAFAQLIRQVKEIQWKVPIYGAYWPSSPVLLKEVGQFMEGVEFVDAPSLEGLLNEAGAELYKQFKAQYGGIKSLDFSFASTYEAFKLVKQSRDSNEPIPLYLSSKIFDGVFGPYKFDENGDLQGLRFAIKRIVNRKPVVIS